MLLRVSCLKTQDSFASFLAGFTEGQTLTYQTWLLSLSHIRNEGSYIPWQLPWNFTIVSIERNHRHSICRYRTCSSHAVPLVHRAGRDQKTHRGGMLCYWHPCIGLHCISTSYLSDKFLMFGYFYWYSVEL